MSIRSGLHTLCVERQLPYRAHLAVQRAARRVGWTERVVTCDGLRFRVRRLTTDESFVRNVVAQREYFPPGMTPQPTDVVVDVGGNIGTFAVLASTMAARVITIEPDPENIRLLHTNIAMNQRLNIAVVEAAIAAHSGSVPLYMADQGGFHTTTSQRAPSAPTRTVRSVTLAEVFERYRIDRCHFLKMDCEGAEFAVLPTLPAAIWDRIDQIAMEYHTPRVPTGAQQAADLLALMQARGFVTVQHHVFSTGTGGHYFGRRT